MVTTIFASSMLVLGENIDKPLADDREYRLIELDNRLRVLLIHDPSTDKAAAALDVNVGSYKDSHYGVPGLAHFCEHLLFMGTQKYPSENEYSQYLAHHGGHSNAYTAFEHTNYYFEVNAGHLHGALDRFSQFFIAPLFDESCKDREINAVDSENKKNLQNDLWRFYQLEKSTANPKHPYNSFSTGNVHTLGEDVRSRGQDVRAVLMDFYSDSYSSNLMSLVVLGKESLDELSSWASEMFSGVANKSLAPPSYNDEIIYTEEQLCKVVKAKSIMNSNRLLLTFMVPLHEEDHWRYQPATYFSHLIGHESKGSIYYLLNHLGLVNELSAGNLRVCANSCVFDIACELTDKGLDKYEDVLVHIFQYLRLVTETEPAEWIFNEIKQMHEVNFRFRQKQSASSTVSKMSNSLYKFESYIPAEYLLNYNAKIEFSASEIKKYGDFLNPKNFRIQLTSRKFDKLDLTEKWYGTSYSYEPIDDALMHKLTHLHLNPDFSLPHKNKFIPEDFEIYGLKAEAPSKNPYLLRDDNKFQIWFKKDDQFLAPKLHLSILLHLPSSNKDIRSSLMTHIFCELIEDELNDINYYASLVGLRLSVYQWRDSILLKLNGYNDKIAQLLTEVLGKLVTFKPTKDKFEHIKNKEMQDFANFEYEVPYQQVNSNLLTLLNEKTYLPGSKLEELKTIDFEHLNSFLENHLWTSGIFVESLAVGNLNTKQLKRIEALLVDEFDHLSPIEASIEEICQIIKLQSHVPAGNTTVDMTLSDEDNVNSSLEYFIHVGELTDYKKRVLVELVDTILSEPCFNQLRTKEQLGYVVFSSTRPLRTAMGYRVLIQSEKSCNFLRTRIESFLRGMAPYLEGLDDASFVKFKQALTDKKKLKLKNIAEESSRLWNHICDGYFDFAVNDKLVEIIEHVTQAEVVDFFNHHIHPDSGAPRVVLNLNSSKAKIKALEQILGGHHDLVVEHHDDLDRLVAEAKRAGSPVTIDDARTQLSEMFPPALGQMLSFQEFRQTFPKGGIPHPVAPLSQFHVNESHL